MSDDTPNDPPIEAQSFVAGVTVVDIGDLRVARGLSRRPYSGCPHTRLNYDGSERRIWCKDCETTIEAFDAFEILVSKFDRAAKEVARRQEQLDTAERFQARSLAARTLDKAWRSKKMLPACPRCGGGLWPEDFKHGCSHVSREYAAALRAREAGDD